MGAEELALVRAERIEQEADSLTQSKEGGEVVIAFTCPECGERPVEVVCIADSDTSFWFNPWGGLGCDEPGEFRCGPCAVASGAVCMLIPPSERRSWEHLAGLVKLRRWEPGEPDRPILAEVERAVREALTGEGGVRREGQAQGGQPTVPDVPRVPPRAGVGGRRLPEPRLPHAGSPGA